MLCLKSDLTNLTDFSHADIFAIGCNNDAVDARGPLPLYLLKVYLMTGIKKRVKVTVFSAFQEKFLLGPKCFSEIVNNDRHQ